jgi:hypothetical protein
MLSSYPFYGIDTGKKPPVPKLFLCKPNRETIGKLTYADKIVINLKMGTDLSELTFTIPKKIKYKDEYVRYKYFDSIKIKYQIRAENVWGTEYYVIDAPKYSNDDDTWTIHCFLLPYQLRDKKFYSYTTTDSSGTDSPVTLKTALTAALSTSYTWTVGHIDDSLSSLYRSFNEDDTTALDFIQTITDSFNATVIWDTVNRTVNMYDTATYTGENKGLSMSRKRYLSSLEEDISYENMVTRLHCFGADDISLNSVNPTGQDYIEDYSYWLNNFSRDENKNVLSHAELMSDSLCNAILDYQELIAKNSTQFSTYLTSLNTLQSSLITLQYDLSTLNNDLLIIEDIISVDIKVDQSTYHYLNKLYNGTGWSVSADINTSQQYIIMAKATTGLTCNVDGNNYSINSTWQVLKKISGQDNCYFTINSGQSSSDITVIVIMITSDEYSTSGNESILIDKYNKDNKQDEINAKQSEIDSTNMQITTIENDISALQTLLSPSNNFTQEQLEEWENYIIEGTFSNSNYTNANDLMTDAKLELAKLQQPTDQFTISIVNFLQIVECQKDWNRLYLNDIVTIEYDNGAKITANVTELDFDFDAGTIGVAISNSKHQISPLQKFAQDQQNAIKAARSLKQNKPTWNNIKTTKSNLDNFLNNAISINSHNLTGGLNDTEGIDSLGYYSKTDELHITRLYRGCIVSTSDGGNTWSLFGSPSGINAAQITGQLLIDENTSVVSSDGSTQITNSGVTLPGSSTSVTGGLSSSEIDPILVNNANLGSQAKSQIDNLSVGTVNYLAKNNCFGNIIDLSGQSISTSGWGLSIQYNQLNGFTVPMIQVKGNYTVSFIAYANQDNLTLNMSLSTRNQDDKTIDHSIVIGTSPQLYQWTVDYDDDYLATKDNYLKFWSDSDIEELIILTNDQLEYGNVRSSWHKNSNDS